MKTRSVLSKLLVMVAVAPVAVLATLTALAGPASAGGWGMSRLDALPEPAPGVPTEVGFTFLQHGRHPVDIHGQEDPVGITVVPAGGDPAEGTFHEARQEGPEGHYLVDVVFPQEGTYTWQVEQGWFGPHDLGEIEVGTAAAAGAAVTGSGGTDYRGPLPVRIALPAVAIAAAAYAGAALAGPRRRRAGAAGAGGPAGATA